MSGRIPQEKKEEIQRLYDNGKGMSPAEIARQTGIPYQTVYRRTRKIERLRQRINPETGKPFESLGQLQDYNARQRINPETGKPFESLGEY